jgi:hypothetical protein
MLAAIQLTIRLIMAFSISETLRGTVAMLLACFPVAFVFDLLTGPDPSFGARLTWAPVAMALMALAGFATCRWVLKFKRLRGQIVAAGMSAILAPHLFTLAPTIPLS